MVNNGAKQALYTLFQVLLDLGDEVIIPAPYWLSYPVMVHLAGGRSMIVPTHQNRNHQLSGAVLAAAIMPCTRYWYSIAPHGSIRSRLWQSWPVCCASIPAMELMVAIGADHASSSQREWSCCKRTKNPGQV